jgi:hypothetical protein
MLKIIMVEKAMVASIVYPSQRQVKNVRKMIRGQLRKYKNTTKT